MTPPSASPFQGPFYENDRVDAYLHPCAKMFSIEEVQSNNQNFRSFVHFSNSERFNFNSTSEDNTPVGRKPSDLDKQFQYKGIEDLLSGMKNNYW